MRAVLLRHAVSITIVLCAVALGLYLYVVDSGRVTTQELEARKRNLFHAWRRAAIDAITIEHQGEMVRIVKRTDDAGSVRYELVNGEAADPMAVDKLLGVLEFATPERRVETGADRDAVGLVAPRARLSLTMGSVTYKLAIGGPAAAPRGGAYAEVEGEGLFVLSRDLVTELLRPGDVYRGRTLVPYLPSSLSELVLQGSGGERRFVNPTLRGFVVVRGDQNIRVDRAAFDRMLTSLAESRAEAFTGDAEADRALADAAVKVRIVMTPSDKGLPRAVLDLGGECPAHPDDIVAIHHEPLPRKSACVPKGVLDGLATPLERFVDLHLFSLRPDEMEEIVLAANGERLEIVRAGTAWHQRAPTQGAVETDLGQALARSLHGLTAEKVMPTLREGSAPVAKGGTATVTRVDAGEEKLGTETIELGVRLADGWVEALRVADGVRLLLTRETAQVLRPSGLVLRSRKVITESANHVRRIAVESPDVRQVLLRSASGGFVLDEPKALAVDGALASDLTEALVQLRADRWVADQDDGTFGFGAGGSRYDLGLEAGQVRIDTGRATSGGVFARLADHPEVFVLGEPTKRAIETWAVDRSYFMLDADEVRHVRFERGATKWELDPIARGGRDGRIVTERFEIVRRALAEARTEGVVHLGPARPQEGFDRPRLVLTARMVPPSPAKPREVRITVGRGDVWRDNSVFYVRRSSVDATFAMAQSKLRSLLDLK